MYTSDKFGMVLLVVLWVFSFAVETIKKDSKPNPMLFIFIAILFYNLKGISEAFIHAFSFGFHAYSFISILIVSLFYLVFVFKDYSDRDYMLLISNASSFTEKIGYVAEAIVRTYLVVGFFAIANLIISLLIYVAIHGR